MPCNMYDGARPEDFADTPQEYTKRVAARLEEELCAIRAAIITGDLRKVIEDQLEHEKRAGCEKPVTNRPRPTTSHP